MDESGRASPRRVFLGSEDRKELLGMVGERLRALVAFRVAVRYGETASRGRVLYTAVLEWTE